MEFIQPFINAADAVLRDNLRCTARMNDVCMDTHEFRRHGIAAVVRIQGDIEGRVVLDVAAETARKMALEFVGSGGDVIHMVQDAVCELANQVIGNAITALNDSGYHFRVRPPKITLRHVPKTTATTEALVMRFDTANGPVYLNVALRGRGQFASD